MRALLRIQLPLYRPKQVEATLLHTHTVAASVGEEKYNHIYTTRTTTRSSPLRALYCMLSGLTSTSFGAIAAYG